MSPTPGQYVPYASLAFGSALAIFLYPHALTGVFASASVDTIRKNAMLLPAYTLLLGLVALLGYMGHAAGLKLSNNNDVVPLLFKTLFPSWFTGFAFAAIAVGALVPAAVMSIGAANLFTRNFWKAYVNPLVTPAGEAKVAKITSLAVKAGALLVVLFLPTQFALDLQLLGGLWILQTFPALIFGLASRCTRSISAPPASPFILVCLRSQRTFSLQFSSARCFGSPRPEIANPRGQGDEANYRHIVLRWASMKGRRWARPRKPSPAAAVSSAADRPG
jgi:Na+/proline symporter